jgi:serine protease Do
MRGSGKLLRILAVLAGLAACAAPAVAEERSAWVPANVGDAAFLGVSMAEETEHPEGGARITRVVPESPAAEAGLEKGDIVIALDGEPIRGPQRLGKRVAEHEPGDRIRLDVLRDGGDLSLDVELGDHPGVIRLSGVRVPRAVAPPVDVRPVLPLIECDDQDDACAGVVAPRLRRLVEADGRGSVAVAPRIHGLFVGDRPKLGVQLTTATPELREHLGAGPDEGVLVSKVLSGTPAEHADIRVGDLIVAVDGEPVRSARDLIAALSDKDGETIDVEIVRDGRRTGVSVTLPETGDGNAA